MPGADLAHVFTLRTLDDSTAIRDAAKGAARAVVVGAGFIGMETAASLRALDVEVALGTRALYGQFRVPRSRATSPSSTGARAWSSSSATASARSRVMST